MSTRLIMLGLLRERPYHGYDLKRAMKARYMDEWAHVAFGSIYFALDQMAHEGLIQARSTEQEGNRPSRTVYGITEAGRREFLRLLREGWQDPQLTQDSLRVCLFFMEELPRDEALSYLLRRTQMLADSIEHIRSNVAGLPPEAPWIGRYIADHDSFLMGKELAWIRGLIADIEGERVEWKMDEQRSEAAASH